MSVKIKYKNVNVGAKTTFNYVTEDALYPAKVSDLKKDFNILNFQNPCEYYSLLLDDNSPLLLLSNVKGYIGFISDEISTDNGIAESIMTLTASSTFSTSGFTFTFDKYNDIYPQQIYIKWYNNDELISVEGADENGGVTFYPTSAEYFCEKQVSDFDKVIITFIDLNMPKNRLKIKCIDYGYSIDINENELRDVKVIQQIDVISSSIISNACDFTIDSETDYASMFVENQMFEIYHNNKIINRTYVKEVNKKTNTLIDVKSEDCFSLLDGISCTASSFYGRTASSFLKDIFEKANLPYVLDDTTYLNNVVIRGEFKGTNCRELLMQVLFIIGAIADTSNGYEVVIRTLNDTVTQHINLDRIKQGQQVKKISAYTGVELTAFRSVSKKEKELAPSEVSNVLQINADFELYDNYSENTIDWLYDYYVNNTFDGQMIILDGKDAVETTPTYDDALYDVDFYDISVIQKDQKLTTVGDLITFDTDYGITYSGRIKKQTFSLKGNIIWKDSEVTQCQQLVV